MRRGTIVQVTNPDHDWFRALVVVEQSTASTVLGFTHVPRQGDAWIRLNLSDITMVGEAVQVGALV